MHPRPGRRRRQVSQPPNCTAIRRPANHHPVFYSISEHSAAAPPPPPESDEESVSEVCMNRDRAYIRHGAVVPDETRGSCSVCALISDRKSKVDSSCWACCCCSLYSAPLSVSFNRFRGSPHSNAAAPTAELHRTAHHALITTDSLLRARKGIPGRHHQHPWPQTRPMQSSLPFGRFEHVNDLFL